MPSDKEALERLKRRADALIRPVNASAYIGDGDGYDAAVFAKHDDIAFGRDLSWLIAEREGLEREVESVRGLNNILSEKLERRTSLYDNAMEKWSADVKEFGSRYQIAESKLSALSEAARSLLQGLQILGVPWETDSPLGRGVNGLSALLHPTVPVESDECPNPNGCEYCRQFGCPRAGGNPFSVPVQDVEGLSGEEPDSYAADDKLMTLEAASQLQRECNCYPGRHVKDFRRAVLAALHVVPPSQGDGTQDLELAAADNNHDALVEALIAEHWFIDPDWGHWGLHKPMDPRRFIKLLLTSFQSHQDEKALCASDDSEERCPSCDCWKLTREMCT